MYHVWYPIISKINVSTYWIRVVTYRIRASYLKAQSMLRKHHRSNINSGYKIMYINIVKI